MWILERNCKHKRRYIIDLWDEGRFVIPKGAVSPSSENLTDLSETENVVESYYTFAMIYRQNV